VTGASGYLILPLALLTAAFATTSADWMVGHSSLAQRALMTGGLALVAAGLWSGARYVLSPVDKLNSEVKANCAYALSHLGFPSDSLKKLGIKSA